MRLWTLISGYEDADGLRRAVESVRLAWPDPDRYPVVYSDGAYRKFPHRDPKSGGVVLELARRLCSFVLEWPVAAPTEFLKRTPYFAGEPGDYALILDCDETIKSPPVSDVLSRLTARSYLVPIKDPTGFGTGWVHRMFRVEAGIHHWGAHEAVFARNDQRERAGGTALDGLIQIIHYPCSEIRSGAKRLYYETGIREDEGYFRQAVGV